MRFLSRRLWGRLAVFAVLVFNPITLIGLWGGSVYWSNKHPKIGEHMGSVAWLPRTATDISYFKSYSYTAFEFTISESEFRKWADDCELAEIRETVRIPRFNRFLVNINDYVSGSDWTRLDEYENRI